jgi:hypothetical protein
VTGSSASAPWNTMCTIFDGIGPFAFFGVKHLGYIDCENGADSLHNTCSWWLEARELRCIPGTCPGVMDCLQRYHWCQYVSKARRPTSVWRETSNLTLRRRLRSAERECSFFEALGILSTTQALILTPQFHTVSFALPFISLEEWGQVRLDN